MAESVSSGKLTLALTPSVKDSECGRYPNIAINNEGTIVEVYHEPLSWSTVMYRVGGIDQRRVNFHQTNSLCVGGHYPHIAINDDGVIVEVHESQLQRKSWYRVGNICGNLIKWADCDHELTSSYACLPAVTLNTTNVVVVFQSAYFGGYHTFYKVGSVNLETKQITWTMHDNRKLFGDEWVTELSVKMNNKGDVIAVGRRVFTESFIFRVGSLADRNVNWKPIVDNPGMSGYTPCVCINDDQNVLVVYQTSLRSLSCSYGKLSPDTGVIVWTSRNEHYDYGTCPSVAMTNDGTVVEAHETNSAIKGNTLFYHTGKLSES